MKTYGKYFNPLSLGRDALWRENIEKAQAAHAVKCLETTEEQNCCPVCSSENLEQLVNIQNYPYLECKGCGHVCSKYVPQADMLSEMYRGDGENANAQQQVYLDYDLYEKRVASIAEPKVQFVSSAITTIDTSINTWIDIGSGAGELLQAARATAASVIGVECDKGLVEMSRGLGAVVRESTASQFLAEAKLGCGDIVSFINVLEHVPQPADEIRNAASAGPEFILAEVPRHPSLASFTSFAFPERAYRHIYPPDHLHIFSDKSLTLLLAENGYESLAEWRFGQDLVDLLMTVMTGMLPSNNTKACLKFMEQNMSLLNKIQESIDVNLFGDTVLALFRRSS